MTKSSEDSPTRRTFMTVMIGLISAVIGVAVAIPILGEVLSPLFKKRDIVWAELGNIDDLKKNRALNSKICSCLLQGKRRLDNQHASKAGYSR